MHQPLTMPNQQNCVFEVVDTQWLQISHKCEGHPTAFHGTCAHFGIIWHLGLKNLTTSPWASSIHNDDDDDNNNNNNNNNNKNNDNNSCYYYYYHHQNMLSIAQAYIKMMFSKETGYNQYFINNGYNYSFSFISLLALFSIFFLSPIMCSM